MSFATLKKNSKNSLQKLQSEVEKINNPQNNNQKNFGDDDRFWKAELDKSGNGYAVIRFLPDQHNEDMAFVRVFNHGFQGPGGWYIENSLTTLGQKDPLAEYNSTLWNSGVEANKEIARKQKRRLTYFSNIYVVEDKANPQNEGKTFLFRYGKKIFDKISSMANPEFEDESPVDIFNLWEGANFKLKIRKVDGFSNYDKSEFITAAPLFDDDSKLEKVYTETHSLQEFLDQKNFKSYDELKTRLDVVLGNTPSPAMSAPTSVDSSEVPFDGGTPMETSSSYREEEVSDEEIIEERIDYKNWDWDLLRNHKKLDLSNSDFNFLPKNLFKLNDLENLDLNWCRSLENLNGLSNLKNLNSIDLGYCSSLIDVSDLAQLNDLNYLNLKSANKVEPKPTTDEMTSREEVLLYQETIRIFSGTIETVPAWDTQTQSWVYIQPSLMNEDRYDTTPPEQLLKVMPELANPPSKSD